MITVIGGGIAGSVAAISVATRGLPVQLFEKTKVPHQKVCGEFISGEGASILISLGVDFDSLGATRVDQFRFHTPKKTLERNLPFSARGLSRAVLDEELLRLARHAGADVRRGVSVRAIHPTEYSIETSEGEFDYSSLVLACGKSDIRSYQNRVGLDSGLIGFKTHLEISGQSALDLAASCDLFVIQGGYFGISPIENGRFDLCMLVEKWVVNRVGTSWEELSSYLAKQNRVAARYLANATPVDEKWVTIAGVPYGFVREQAASDEIYCVGDQMAVIPSLTGDGMSIAATTARAAAEAICTCESSQVYQDRMRAYLAPQVAMGYRLHHLFKRPWACDLAASALQAVPAGVDFLFKKTRAQVGLSNYKQ